MSRVLLAAMGLALALVGQVGPVPAECVDSPEGLTASAEAMLSSGGPLDAEVLTRARDLYLRARLQDPSLANTLRSADLADAAGDVDEAGRLLERVAATDGELLSPWERMTLARRAEARGDRRGAIFQYGHVLTAMERRGQAPPDFIGERIRRLDAEEEARLIPVRAYPAPSPEAQRAFGAGKQALARGDRERAEGELRRALRLSPGYVEAALSLASLLARDGRTSDAIGVYRAALAADPESFEALQSLANLLWAEPDRQAKEESLALLDRALSLRPELTRLYKESSDRWAGWGDAARALERLDAYRLRVDPRDRAATDAARERLAQRALHSPNSASAAAATPAHSPPDASSPAIGPFRLAQVYARRDDEASRLSALRLLAEAERLDPRFSAAPDLAARLHEGSGDVAEREAALRRSISADSTRATTYERLGELLERQPGRRAEAGPVWEQAERAGSREGLFRVAQAAESRASSSAPGLYRRYLDEAPDGPHAEEARVALSRLARGRRRAITLAASLFSVVLVTATLVALVRTSGSTLEDWLRRDPSAVRDIRPATSRLRHEVLKHGGLLLADVSRVLGGEPEERAGTAALLHRRLFGDAALVSGRGLVSEAEKSLAEIHAIARARGFRLNMRHKDPVLQRIVLGLAGLGVIRDDLGKLAVGRELGKRRMSRVILQIEKAASSLNGATARQLGRLLDDVSSTRIESAHLCTILSQAAAECGARAPELEPLGLLASPLSSPMLRVRVEQADWDTIFRNLFANALVAGKETSSGSPPALGLWLADARDPVTGQRLARLVLCDDIVRPLTAEMIRGRAAERGLGIVADLVRRHDGLVDVCEPPAGTTRYRKGILLEFVALEEDA